jgi:putative acyl-CoA dehydrogenase
VQCLDVIRATQREPAALAALLAAIDTVQGADTQLDGFIRRIKSSVAGAGVNEAGARRWVEDVALALTAGELIKHAPAAVAQAYCRTRLAADRSLEYGGIVAEVPLEPLLQRALPES